MTTTPSRENPDRSWTAEGPESKPAPLIPTPAPSPRRRGVNGRRFILGSLAALVTTWAILFAILAPWMRTRDTRIRFGVREVAPLVLKFQQVEPPGVEPRDWDRALSDTRMLVVDAATPGKLTVEEETALRDEIQAALDRARARPETAVRELAGVWDRLAAAAEKVRPAGSQDLDRSHPRPPILPTSETSN